MRILIAILKTFTVVGGIAVFAVSALLCHFLIDIGDLADLRLFLGGVLLIFLAAFAYARMAR